MNVRCPNSCSSVPAKHGQFFRKSDSKWIQRFKCGNCSCSFSSATYSSCYRQKKRRINSLLASLLASGVSMRRAALVLGVHRMTVSRRQDFLADQARKLNQRDREENKHSVTHLQLDDLITSCHTKLKPLSVSIAVDASTRKILAAEVSQIPAFGRLAELSRQKYGRRKNRHKEGLKRMFELIKDVTHPNATIKSDEHQNYKPFVERYFPHSNYQQYKSLSAQIAGQGELKKGGRDPLFCINHTLAMLRANLNRLIRRTWCTTKKWEKLQNHLQIYMQFHNTRLV